MFKAAMLVFRTNPVVVELSSHVNVFFCNHKLTQMLVIRSIVPKRLISGQSLQRSWAAANRFIRQFFKKSISFSFLSNFDRSISNPIKIHCHRNKTLFDIKSFRFLGNC